MSLKTRIQAGIQIKQTGSADLGESNLEVPFASEIALAHGTSTGKADKAFADHRTLAASATEDLDLENVVASPREFVSPPASILKVANSAGGTPVSYDVILVGTSA